MRVLFSSFHIFSFSSTLNYLYINLIIHLRYKIEKFEFIKIKNQIVQSFPVHSLDVESGIKTQVSNQYFPFTWKFIRRCTKIRI